MFIVIYHFMWMQLTLPYDKDNPIDMAFYAFLHWMLAPLEATWLSLAWVSRFQLWIATPLILRLMEGAWWTFFFWSTKLMMLPSFLLNSLSTLKTVHPTPYQDVRFWVPMSLSVDLYYGGMSHFTTRQSRPRDTSRSRLSKTGFTVRVRWRDISLTYLLRRISSLVRLRLATYKASTSARHNNAMWLSYYGYITRHEGGPPSTMSQLEKISDLNGIKKRTEVQELLERLPPLDLLAKEMAIRCQLLGLQSEANKMEKAFIAAADLVKELQGRRAPNSVMSGAYLCDQTSSDLPCVFDTGASLSVTPLMTDFVTPLEDPQISDMKGLADTVKIKGKGTIEWTIRDVFGKTHTIRTEAYFIPQASIRLFSPQTYFQEAGGKCEFDSNSLSFTMKDGNILQFPYHPASNLPMMYLDWNVPQAGFTSYHLNFLRSTDPSSTILESSMDLLRNNHNLGKPAKEALLWHYRLGHAGFRWIQDLMRVQKQSDGSPAEPPVIPTKIAGTANCISPKCAACQLAKQHRRTPGSSTVHVVPERQMDIRKNHLQPGDCVSVDQYLCRVKGRKPNTAGKEPDSDRYNGGTIFVDHASTYMSIHHQVSMRVGETLIGKHNLERHARQHGFKIKGYRADNHPFEAVAFLQDLELQDQTITYSGVGAHHQNGVAERGLQTTTTWARAMMMHQLIHWPEEFDPALWPFAMEHAVYIWNNMPKQRSGLTPAELFSGMKSPQNDAMTRARVWGCPVFVLDPKLQDGKKIPKWTKRSRQGMYLGASPEHSSTVGRVLNTITGYISPQYHVVYDELFQTVHGKLTDEVIDPDLWQGLLALDSLENAIDSVDLQKDPDRRPTDNQGHHVPFEEFFEDFTDQDDDDDSSSTSVPEGDEDGVSQDGTSVTEGAIGHQVDDSVEGDPPRKYTTRSGRTVSRGPKFVAEPARCRKAATFVGQTMKQVSQPHRRPQFRQEQYLAGNTSAKIRSSDLQNQYLQGLDWSESINKMRTGAGKRQLLAMLKDYDHENGTQEDWAPLALAAKANDADADTLTFSEAMNHPNSEGFWQAAKKEIDTLEEMDVWDEVPREPWMNVLPGTWAFRIKRFPTGLIRKLKARFCARGDRQIENVDFFDTFAPVVSWTTVRLLLILSIELQLATKQVDYTAAFVHADIDLPPNYKDMTPQEQQRQGVYIDMPRGFAKEGTVLKLKKSLYGLRQSPRYASSMAVCRFEIFMNQHHFILFLS